VLLFLTFDLLLSRRLSGNDLLLLGFGHAAGERSGISRGMAMG
jgi:hypothetical protein